MQNVNLTKTIVTTSLKWVFIIFILVFLRKVSTAQTGPIRINEFLASNSTSIRDFEYDQSDWIELYNDSDSEISLLNWVLTDDTMDIEKWVFPDVTIEANGFMLLFASGKDIKDNDEMHTNFKLSANGEYLGLFDDAGNVAHEFHPEYPMQQEDITFGFIGGEYAKIASGTPGYSNESSHKFNLVSPVFSQQRGFFEESFALSLTGEEGTEIYYTLDGSAPSLSNGHLYTGALNIETTKVVRAASFDDEGNQSSVMTNSYIFLEDVIHQPNDPEGYPSLWGPYVQGNGRAIADYEMDPSLMNNASFASDALVGLKSLPTVSISTDLGFLFSDEQNDERGGIYVYTGPPLSGDAPGYGLGWERPVSFEYIDEEGNVSLHENCGIRLQGGHSRRPEKSPKHSFRLAFRSEYGASKFNYPFFGEDGAKEFNGIALKAGFGNTWIHHSHAERNRAQYVRDIWGKDTQRAMGYVSAQAKYIHLYINGIYWGMYHVTERLDKSFADSYLEGNEDDFDIMKDGGTVNDVIDGNITIWNRLQSAANAGFDSDDDFFALMGLNADGSPNKDRPALINMPSFMDYMMMNLYGGNTDWDHHNWAAMKNRNHDGLGYQFLSWDAEHLLKTLNENVTFENNNGNPSRLYNQMRGLPAFARMFADRVQKNFFNGGEMEVEKGTKRWVDRANIIQDAVNAESARWGDYRKDVHRNQPQGPFELYNKYKHWNDQLDFMTNTYFPQRIGRFLTQLRAIDLFPSLNAPLFMVGGNNLGTNVIDGGEVLNIQAGSGTIYYTTDGTDPVRWTGSGTFSGVKSDNALTYGQPINLNNSTHIIARVCNNGICSAASEAVYSVVEDLEDIRVTEIHYNPADGNDASSGDFEFIEIKNVGNTSFNLKGAKFTKGIDYTFDKDAFIDAKGFIVLASSTKYFYDRYGFMPYDKYGDQLNNGGESISLQDQDGTILFDFAYSDQGDWPTESDGSGYSIVPKIIDPDKDQSSGDLWRSSSDIGGSPGEDDLQTIATEEDNLDELIVLNNWPNPFSRNTEISFTVLNTGKVSLGIYSLNGQLLDQLINEQKHQKGTYKINWNSPQSLTTGTYVVSLKREGLKEVSRKIIKVE